LVSVKQLHPVFFVEISGIDVSRPLSPAGHKAIVDAIDRYAVVVFHDQKLTDDQQIDFTRHFGPVHSPAQKARHREIKHRLEREELADISNLNGDSNVLEENSKRRLDWLANRFWHTDASFRAAPGALSMLYAHVVPPSPAAGRDECRENQPTAILSIRRVRPRRVAAITRAGPLTFSSG